jgi:hypothetical protein
MVFLLSVQLCINSSGIKKMTASIVGVIEGFYGPPWTHVQRLHLLDTMAMWGWNSYVWAAKLEPRHRAEWNEAFTQDERAQFAELAQRQASVGVYIGLTPGAGATIQHVIDKLQPAVDAGISGVSLCFDDLPVLSAAAQHRELANAVIAQWGLPVWITPTHYAGVTSSPYLDALCDGLDPAVKVMWTGDMVVTDAISVADANLRVRATGGRAPLVWDNAPVNDALMRAHLHLGPFTGREQALLDVCSGFLWNPMQEFDASLVMLESAAAWWRGDDAIAAWNETVDRNNWRQLAEATAYRTDAHWPGEEPSREWWESVRDMNILDESVAPWVQSAQSGARVALAAMTIIETDTVALTPEARGALLRPLIEWTSHRQSSAYTFGRGPRQRPCATQNDQGKFVLQPASVTESESLVDLLVHRALQHLRN